MDDVLSDLLRAIRLDSAIYFHSEFSEPWSVTSPDACLLVPKLAPERAHLVTYHLLCEGTAYVESEGERIALAAGDLIMFPHGHAHIMGGGEAVEPFPIATILTHIVENRLEPIRLGGGGTRSRFICGYLVCDRQFAKSFFAGLPRVVRVSLRGDESGRWLESSLKFAVEEAVGRKAGGSAMLTRLSEAAFVETLRRFVRALPDGHGGWLAGARDRDIGKALMLLHQRYTYRWTVAELAQQTGVSRTVLAGRFRELLGEAPMAYLTRWRLLVGARTLTTTSHGIAQIAADVGYESEAAFNRAFKRSFGVPPARYRKDMSTERTKTTPALEHAH